MTQATERDESALQAELEKLRQTLANLEDMARLGLSVDDVRAQAQERLAALEARIAVTGDVRGDLVAGTKITAHDQRGQQVDTQVNIAHLY